MAPRGTVQDLEPARLPAGMELGPWRVLELRGKGTYGAVYRVEPVEEAGAEPCALKLALHPVDPRFWREVELLSRIDHPNVPRLKGRGLWGLAKDALTVSANVEARPVSAARQGFSLEVPKKPLPGQKRPPCEKPKVAINGGCWGEPKNSKPPCGEGDYEWNGVCYYPIVVPPPPPTSESL